MKKIFLVLAVFLNIFIISCGEKKMITKTAIIKIGTVSSEYEKILENIKNSTSRDYVYPQIVKFKNNEDMIKALENNEINTIFSEKLFSSERDDMEMFPVYQDKNTYNIVYLIYLREKSEERSVKFLKYEIRKKEVIEHMEKNYKDRFAFFPELFDIKEKIENTSWKLADISGQKIKAELYTKKEIKTNGKEDIILSVKDGQIYGNIGLYGTYSGKYEISSRDNTISFKINEFKDLSESNKKVSEIEREFLHYLKEVRIINIIDENTLFMGIDDPDNYLVFKRYHLK